MTDTTQTTTTGSDLLERALADMFANVDPSDAKALTARRGPTGRKVRHERPNSAQRDARLSTAAKPEMDGEAGKEIKPVCTTSWYVGTFADSHKGAAEVLLTHRNERALVTKSLMRRIRKLGVDPRFDDRVKVRVIEKKGKPSLKVTHLKIGDQIWSLDLTNVPCAAKDRDAEPATEPARFTGTVKWFNPDKRFGFIAPAGGGEDAFVHISAVEAAGRKDLDDEAQIEYDLVRSEVNGKLCAENLKLL